MGGCARGRTAPPHAPDRNTGGALFATLSYDVCAPSGAPTGLRPNIHPSTEADGDELGIPSRLSLLVVRPQVDIERDLARLADGTLAPERVSEVEAEVAESPELSAQLAEQRAAVTALRSL